MKPTRQHRLVLVTAPDRKTARRIAQAALAAKLVACANLVFGLESHYWWRGKLERSAEVLVLFKTVRKQVAALEKLVLELHPYDTPELLVVPAIAGNARYLDWIGASARPGRETPRGSTRTV